VSRFLGTSTDQIVSLKVINSLNSEAIVLASFILLLSIVGCPLCASACLKLCLVQSVLSQIRTLQQAGNLDSLPLSYRACLRLEDIVKNMIAGIISTSQALQELHGLWDSMADSERALSSS
jgi:hypothetical protein